MYYQRLTDDEILSGFREGDAGIIREYFYGYCQVGYNIFDQRYQLREKENLDFMSLAHQYALYLMEHDWKPLEDHSPNVSLKTWLINGFRYVVLDALKWYRKEYGSITFEDYLMSFDVTSDLRKLKEQIIVPYFRKNFDMDLDMPEVMDEMAILRREATMGEAKMSIAPMPGSMADMAAPIACEDMDFIREEVMEQKRTTPEFITELQPNEIFVFGSNLKGMHGGGAAYIAYRKFGAIMGQGVGLQGQSYAIPTMQGGVETIRPYVDEFIAFAKENKNLTFLVTRIGCGIAGFTDDEISPLFEKAHHVENIVLPPGW